MTTATRLSLKTDVDIDGTNERATFSIWLNNESEAYTIRVEPLTEDQREDYDGEYTHAIRDGYGEDNYYSDFDTALTAAWGFYQDTQTENIAEAGY